jgi:hypothetical protein
VAQIWRNGPRNGGVALRWQRAALRWPSGPKMAEGPRDDGGALRWQSVLRWQSDPEMAEWPLLYFVCFLSGRSQTYKLIYESVGSEVWITMRRTLDSPPYISFLDDGCRSNRQICTHLLLICKFIFSTLSESVRQYLTLQKSVKCFHFNFKSGLMLLQYR